jgi:predicted esterase
MPDAHNRTFLRLGWWSRGLAFCAVLIALNSASGHIIITKDGFTIKGTVKREGEMISDPGGAAIPSAKPGGFFWIDDGPRRVAISHKQIQDISTADKEQESKTAKFENRFLRLDRFRLPPGYITQIGRWSPKWDRTIKLNGKLSIEQHLSLLSSHYARIDARHYNWSPHYLIDELHPEEVRTLLYTHPELKQTGGKDDAAKRFRVFRFFVEAGWLEQALAELNKIEADFPDQSSKVATGRSEVQRLLAAKSIDLLEEGHGVGRHDWVQAHLRDIDKDNLDDKQKQRLRALQSTYEALRHNQFLAQRYLESFLGRVKSSQQRIFFGEAVQTILAELNPDTIDRLETFLRLSESAERNKDGVKEVPEEMLALAVTGWLHGNKGAETRVDSAEQLWRTRQFVLDYQRQHNALSREQAVAQYKEHGAVAFDELAQLIHFLPPAEPRGAVSSMGNWIPVGALPLPAAPLFTGLMTVRQMLTPQYLRLKATIPWSPRKGPDYVAQLPPEYHPGRLYPVLFVLHDGGESPEGALPRWSRQAAKNGYFLVAPEWDRTGRLAYDYTAFEQAAVTEVLRDLFQHFQVDPDRVFVAGNGEGGNMAYDVGLSHPDLFAGIVSISGRPRYFARTYWHNAQELPFYVVDGESDGDLPKDNRSIFQHWIPKGYPAIYVQYKGRGHDWFDAEYPIIFDWMNRKKRAMAVPNLGAGSNGGAFGDEYQTMRETDNRFYWVGLEHLFKQNLNDLRHWSTRAGPATVQGHLGEANRITLNAHGFKTLTIWFRQGMINFERPVTVTLNLQVRASNRRIAPSLETLLEDFFFRADRHRLYLAKLELNL